MKIEAYVKLTPEQVANAFTDMDDEEQAQVFIEIAAIADKWPMGRSSYQWYLVGRHLAKCACSTFEAREIVRDIYGGIEARD